jgi:hypothetical protein
MKAPNELYVVDGGDHSLLVAKGQLKAIDKTQEQVEEQILEAIRLFVAGYMESGVR